MVKSSISDDNTNMMNLDIFLKNCGRPITEEDKFWITHHKDVVSLNSKYLD